MRCCGNCSHNHRSLDHLWICDLLHTEVVLNDDGCLFHDLSNYNILD